jgi:uncharacterized repeat protein (TIGR03803 family)
MKVHVKRLLIMSAFLAGIQLADAQTFTNLYSFTGGDDGEFPACSLIQTGDGLLYGTTQTGGINGFGTVFRVTTGGTLTTIHSFSQTGADGSNPRGSLMQAGYGTIYGMTFKGGTHNVGAIFRVVFAAAPTAFSFSATNGSGPSHGALIQASDGNFYGTTQLGGGLSHGSIFRFADDGSGSNNLLYSFGSQASDGGSPVAGLVQASDGNLYGTTFTGGGGGGTIFKITTNGVYTSLYSFASGNDGANPEAGLMQASDGNLYGTTSGGGTNSYGTIYRITTNGDYASLYSFTGGNDGAAPSDDLIQAADGNLYGTTSGGGADFDGTIFKFTTNGVFTLLYTFTGGDDGSSPGAALMQAADGNLYGTTSAGGADGYGTVFKLTIASPPALNISSGGNQSALYWAGSSTNYLVQSVTNLACTNWVTITNGTPIVGVTVSNTAPAQFFRLVTP